ncbi:hypothetical protein E4T66_03510 [Sinimarinibacterium sp. CAU 1509]|uniref:hypothetical protein n=1 Tax=Sinimarinibacterium sp. CAU 1509 TaxID=2562283 RepID=UPI0010AC3246|nr:hypothetical protein [Sinimarinibacterium sp. CAU 1509]TJY62801.1 hypothetical protein E4T66_03510 [Sinimarinibacterium sp. CAU 1509]
MANHPRAIDPRVRESRQRAYLSVPTLARQMPSISEIAVELRFMYETGQPFMSPYRQIFVPDMQAYFEFQCPDRDCSGAGFDMTPAISAAVRAGKEEISGTLKCRGSKSRTPCSITLDYKVETRLRESGN